MAKRDLNDCRTSRDFIRYAERRGGYIDRQNGSHAIIKAPGGGTCPVPVHPGEIPTGTRHSIIKRFMVIGLLLVMAWFVIAVI